VTVELAVRVAILLAAGALARPMLRRMHPASRHAFWLATVIACLALPLTTLVSPAWSVPAAPDPIPTVADPIVPPEDTGAIPAALPSVTFAWACGAGFVALYFLSGYARLWRIRRLSHPAPPPWAAAAARLSARSRLERPVNVAVSPSVRGPIVAGLWSAAVLIPPDACSWSEARREAVLIHELAHVRRGDLAAQLAAQILVTIHWFNPLAWYALGEMRRERELACDEAVLGAGVAPLEYATELLAIATAGPARPLPGSALSMARVSELEGRLCALLDAGPRTRQRRASSVALALLLVPISGVVAGAHLAPPGPVASSGAPRRAVSWTILPAGELRPSASEAAWATSSGDEREWDTVMLAMTPGNAVIPPLLRALEDPDAGVREKAALGLAWRRDDRVGPALVAATADPSPGVREKALVALAFSGEPRAAAVIEAARTDPDPGVRKKARALREVKSEK
jgi:beta-lactamase regulating signal transducer with metallopeptidase domain